MSLKRKPTQPRKVIDSAAIEAFSSKAPNVSPIANSSPKKSDEPARQSAIRKIFSLQAEDIDRIDECSKRALSLDAGDVKAVTKDSFIVRVALKALENADDQAFYDAVAATAVIKAGKPKA